MLTDLLFLTLTVQDTSNLWSPEGARLRKALVLPVKDKPAFNAFLVGSTSKVRIVSPFVSYSNSAV